MIWATTEYILCCFNRHVEYTSQVMTLESQEMTTAKPFLNISVKLNVSFSLFQFNIKAVSILSVLNDKILVGWESCNTLFICNQEGATLQTVNGTDEFYDAVWTATGNIVYTNPSNRFITTMSLNGDVLNRNALGMPMYLSVCNDNFIYVADGERGVYESTNSGLNWRHVIQSVPGWSCIHVIKVVNNNDIKYWILELHISSSNRTLRLYNEVNKNRQLNNSEPWATINVPIVNKNSNNSLEVSFLSQIPRSPVIVLSDMYSCSVHVLLATGQYYRELLSCSNIDYPYKIIADKRQAFYVGLERSTVKKFDIFF